MRLFQNDITEAAQVLGPLEGDEPTEEAFERFQRWSDDKQFGPATAMEVYERAVLRLRHLQGLRLRRELEERIRPMLNLAQDLRR